MIDPVNADIYAYILVQPHLLILRIGILCINFSETSHWEKYILLKILYIYIRKHSHKSASI